MKRSRAQCVWTAAGCFASQCQPQTIFCFIAGYGQSGSLQGLGFFVRDPLGMLLFSAVLPGPDAPALLAPNSVVVAPAGNGAACACLHGLVEPARPVPLILGEEEQVRLLVATLGFALPLAGQWYSSPGAGHPPNGLDGSKPPSIVGHSPNCSPGACCGGTGAAVGHSVTGAA